MKRLPAVVVLFLAGSLLVLAEETPLLVVTDLRTVGEESAVAESRAFTQFIREQIAATEAYRVLSRASMLAILDAKSFPHPCDELPCFVNMGAALDASVVIAGHLQNTAGSLELTLHAITVEERGIASTVYRKSDQHSMDDLLGGWGIGVLSELLEIPPGQFQREVAQTTAPDAIPGEILFRYPDMIYIPRGVTHLGSNQGDPAERPPHMVTVDAFYIGRFEVTNREYAIFVRATGHRTPPHWVQGQVPPGLDEHPVTWVSFEDAEAYCQWKGARLPTEAEWARAARGSEALVYPWGNQFDASRTNTWESDNRQTIPVGSLPGGASVFGVEDLSGNVLEWTSGFFRPWPGAEKTIPDEQQHKRVLRGGSWNFGQDYARISHRMARVGGERSRSFGFRMVRDAPSVFSSRP